MSLTDPWFRGKVSEDCTTVHLATWERPRRLEHLRRLGPGADVAFIVRRWKNVRSKEAAGYYFGVVLALIAEHASGDATPIEVEDLHEYFKAKFLTSTRKRVEFVNTLTGEVLEAGDVDLEPSSTQRMSGDEFWTYVEQIRQWAVQTLGVETPDPDPALRRARKK